MRTSPGVPATAQYVIVGGGVHGLSTAYHLAERLEELGGSAGRVLVLEKRRLGAGASGICGGIVRNFYLAPELNEIVRRSIEIFELDPHGFGFHQVGYLAAVSEEQAGDLERIAWQHEQIGYESNLVVGRGESWEYLRDLFRDWRAKSVTAVLHEPRGGWADPTATVANLGGMARSLGVQIVEGVEVLDFELDGEIVRSVVTSAGTVACDLVVVCPGPWVRDLWRLLALPDGIDMGDRRAPFSYLKVREGDFVLRSGERLPERAPVVHLDVHEPLLSDRDRRVLHPGPWGIYFRSGAHGGIQGGGLPGVLDAECELDPYGPSHPEHGSSGPDFDEWFTSALAVAFGRFRGRSADWDCHSYGAQVAFTPDSYPVLDFVRPNAYVVLDSNHGFKMLALGRLAAEDILDGSAAELKSFRLDRFARAELHPVSASPYPWT
ncbi:MAG TPA: FAD-binding oxidoreductase [Gaiellaceae bacterium]|nr:FAD-binding oxidoreductase [Gaiellaceae bacterium]